MLRRALGFFGALAVVLVGFGSPAAAGPVSTLAGPCGGGYALVGHYPVGNQHTDRIDMYLDVYYSAAAKRNCLVANHNGDAYGVVRDSMAKIRPSGAAWPACSKGGTGCDRWNYAYYAGPVYTPAGVDMSNRCIDFGGTAGIQVTKIFYNKHC